MNLFQRWKQTALHNRALVLTGFIVAIGTIFGTGAAVFQVWMVRENNRTTAEQTDKLIRAANIQADASAKNANAAESFAKSADGMNTRIEAAEKDFQRIARDSEKSSQIAQAQAAQSLNASVDASRADQRAWFGISDFEVLQYDPDDPQTPFRLRLGLRNSGKTPALQIKALGMFQVYSSKVDGPTDADWNTFRGFFSKDTDRFVAAPGANRMLVATDANNHFVTNNYAAIKAKTSFLYYFGQINYVDVDGSSHVTKFCLWLAEPERKQLIHCENGNDMN